MPNELIGLAEMVAALRDELVKVTDDAAHESLRFAVGPVELEVQVQVTRETTGQGGLKLWVISADIASKAQTATTHRVKLALTPITADSVRDVVEPSVARRSPK